ncbi:MAG: site-specific integrase [Actinobacteria bacterium]|nr:site-specific integrase [Actinomycetota bacterium]
MMRDGRPVRGKYRLFVNLPREIVYDEQGEAVRDERGRVVRSRPRLTKIVEASGKRDAQRLLEQWIDELEQHGTTDPGRLTVAGLLDRWLAAVRNELRVATYDSYARIVRLHLKPVLGSTLARELTREDLTAYYAAKRETLAETTVRHHHDVMATCLAWAEEEGLVLVNQAARVKRKPRLDPKVRPVWSVEQLVSAAIACRGIQPHAACVLAGHAGLREGEICALRWEDLDLEVGLVKVTKTVEQAEETKRLVEYPPKNGKPRVVPLSSFAVEELRDLQRRQTEYRLAAGPEWNACGYVLPKLDGSQMAPSTLKSIWWRWAKDARLRPHLPLHGLRDSFGTWVYETWGVKQAQEWLGHSDPATTLRHYVRLTKAAEALAVEGLEARVQQAVQAVTAEKCHNGVTPVLSLDEARQRKRLQNS